MTRTYDPNNIFAKILRGEAPCVKLYEDEAAFAFMDVMPRGDGHALVIPKAAARNILDVDPADLARLMPALQKIARAAMTGLDAPGVSIQQFNEEAGGQQVFHLHFHVLPRWPRIALRPPGGPIHGTEALRPQADKIIAALGAA